MKSDLLLDAIGLVSDEAILDARAKTRPHAHTWIRWAAACLCLVLIGTGLFLLPSTGPSLVLTAYATEADGTLSAHSMEINSPVPLDKIELDSGFHGFLFSCPLSDPEAPSSIPFLSIQPSAEKPAQALYQRIEASGLQYFYYIPAQEEELPIRFSVHITEENGDYFRYEIVIEKGETGYTATLEDLLVRYAQNP